jgi:hypothetical protein
VGMQSDHDSGHEGSHWCTHEDRETQTRRMILSFFSFLLAYFFSFGFFLSFCFFLSFSFFRRLCRFPIVLSPLFSF